ncbi:hypothetical protein [Gordonia sp. UCD-TK1]|uniref:hypothetical protein n=1 Tax=Gordonia sp. UCD-TK1 TaxID=1857893 RepID=UPI00080EB1F2|nr:hypothetical protein [Gordonia sp. UCD-TK1]OCH80973.1 hypothetical protein A9310_19610 [Gordonia sp. UCD-TK1]
MPDTATQTHLSEQQLARVEALKAARDVLASKSFVSSGAVDPAPLIDIADYVVTGVDRRFECDAEDRAEAVLGHSVTSDN